MKLSLLKNPLAGLSNDIYKVPGLLIEDICVHRFEGFGNYSYGLCVQGQQRKIDQADSRHYLALKVANGEWQEGELIILIVK
jgi:hypothetical protein